MQAYDGYIELFIKETGFDKETAAMIYNAYISTLPEIIGNMEKGFKNMDFILISRLAHQLKGSSGNLRVATIYNLAFELEQSLNEGKYEASKAIFSKIKESLN